MADLEKALFKTKQKEDIYTKAVNDPGLEDVWGVTRRDYPNDSLWKVVDEAKKRPDFPKCLADMPEIDARVKEIYREKYWNKIRGDELPQEIAEELFDTAVNCGVGTAVGILEKVLNVGNREGGDYPDAPEDGKFDESDALRLSILIGRRGMPAIVKALNVLQGARYYEICKANPKLEKFWWGWLTNRA